MKIFKPVFKGVKKPFKLFKVYLKQKAGWLGIPRILPYRGFGNEEHVYIKGMVIEDKGLAKPDDKTRVWKNMLSTIKRFSGDEIPGVRVQAEFHGIIAETVTDELGFFSFYFNVKHISEAILKRDWHPVKLTLLDEITENQPEVVSEGEVRIVSSQEERIIVSDIDDTVLISHSTTILPKLKLMLFRNAHTRMPFTGVASFYNALERGPERDNYFPFFYVSSSEWNLYDLLEDFFKHNKLPRGVFMLRKLEHSIYKFWKSGSGSHDHKYDKIKFLMELYKNQKFILIGDSGQKDPKIYNRLANHFPGRIESIYIRQIRKTADFKSPELMAKSLQRVNTSYLQVKDTKEAAIHAVKMGYMHPESFSEHLIKAEENTLVV